MQLDDMNEQEIRNQIQTTLNTLADSANDYQMSTQDVVDQITLNLPLLEYLCKTALNVSHLERPKTMTELINAAEDIALQHLGSAYAGEMENRHDGLAPVNEFEITSEQANKQFQESYNKSLVDSDFKESKSERDGMSNCHMNPIKENDDIIVSDPKMEHLPDAYGWKLDSGMQNEVVMGQNKSIPIVKKKQYNQNRKKRRGRNKE